MRDKKALQIYYHGLETLQQNKKHIEVCFMIMHIFLYGVTLLR